MTRTTKTTTEAETERCETCKGEKRYEQKYTEITPAGQVEKTLGMVDCFTCKGAGRMPKGYFAAYRKAAEAFWCVCGEASTPGDWHDDGECAACDKHHGHCGRCGKISQVG